MRMKKAIGRTRMMSVWVGVIADTWSPQVTTPRPYRIDIIRIARWLITSIIDGIEWMIKQICARVTGTAHLRA